MKSKSILYIGLVAAISFSAGCKKALEENAYNELLTDNFYNNKTEVISAVLRPYTHASAWVTPSGNDNWWRLGELSADQLAWPTKGPHGEDGGKWKRLHYHTWTTDESGLNRAWSLMYSGVGYCNDAIGNIERRDIASMGITEAEKASFLSELKLLRALHYLKLVDLFGNVPVVTKVGEPENPETLTRQEVFNFVEKEINENIAAAPKHSKAMTGRMSQAGAYAMLVELYLNAEVWTGTPRWDDCIAVANKLISGEAGGQNGAMTLDPNILDQFKPDNNLSKEAILSIAYDYGVARFEPKWPDEFYHFKQREIYGGGRNGHNGVVLVPGVYTTFANNDLRKSNWLLKGPMVKFSDGVSPVLGQEEYSRMPLIFVDSIQKVRNGSTVSNMSEGEENSGIRFNKYKLGNQDPGPKGIPAPNPNYNNTDWNIYRLTWIYFAKAEAIIRKNGGVATQEAVDLINACKSRVYTPEVWAEPGVAYTPTSLTLDELLAERGREFIFEGFRRNDLIRFGKFNIASWWDHQPSNASKALFPIPQIQLDLNKALKQNPGY